MERHTTSTSILVQTIRDCLSGMTWTAFLGVLVFSCIATRVISGLQSRQREFDLNAPRTSRLAPYWFPWLGHGFQIVWNHLGLFKSLRESMNEPVFGIYLRGESYDTVVSPSMINTVMSSNASNAPMLDQALQNVFGDRSLVCSLQVNHDQETSDNVAEVISKDSFATEVSPLISKCLQDNVSNFVTFSRSPVDMPPWERDSDVTLSEEDNSVCEVKLYELVRNFMGHNLTTLLMGEAFLENFPMFLGDLWTLDRNYVPLFVGARRWVPSPGVSSGFAARDRLIHVMSVFYRAFSAFDDGIDPGIELRDLDDVSELVKQRMRTFRKLNLSPGASAAGNLSLYWDIVEHTTKVTFWMIVHIFADSALLKEIRTEIASCVKSIRFSREETGFPFDEPPKLDLDLENLLVSCPMFKACYYETLRMHSAGISLRKLNSDLTLTESKEDASEPRTYKLCNGKKVIMPHGVYYNDPQRFSNPGQYDPLRFIVNEPTTGANQANADPIAPFADGLYGSKHNNFTKRAILGFTASIISMWDIQSASEKELAVPPHRTTWGAFHPAKDIKVKLKPMV
ncbi:hypothetical protein N7523_003048 [Penicillium sp. IBT 18751x]|nr:hypothetical protein N7523_003048 [Penicillium sp. IBT 18751x]